MIIISFSLYKVNKQLVGLTNYCQYVSRVNTNKN